MWYYSYRVSIVVSCSFCLILLLDTFPQIKSTGSSSITISSKKILPSHHYHHPIVIPILPITSDMECNRSKALGMLLYQEQKASMTFFALLLHPPVYNSANTVTRTPQGNNNHHVTFSITLESDWLGGIVEGDNQEGTGGDTEHRNHVDQQWKMPPKIITVKPENDKICNN